MPRFALEVPQVAGKVDEDHGRHECLGRLVVQGMCIRGLGAQSGGQERVHSECYGRGIWQYVHASACSTEVIRSTCTQT